MALTTRSALIAAAGSAPVTTLFSKSVSTSTVWNLFSSWNTPGAPVQPASLPVASATCSNTTVGAMAVPTAAPGTNWYPTGFVATGTGAAILLDRLANSQQLQANTANATVQTVNLSLPARATETTSVGLYLEISSSWANTQVSNAAISYTNSAGVAGRTVTLPDAVPINGPPGALLGPFALLAGDTGIQSVQTLTMSSTSTPSAGSYSLVFARPIAVLALTGPATEARLSYADMGLIPLGVDPCLFLATTSATGAAKFNGSVTLLQG